MTVQKDLYEVLQVGPSVDQEAIRTAYRALAQRFHPDLNSSPQAAELMKQVNEAYGVLSDPVKRAAYDRRLDPLVHYAGSGAPPWSGEWPAERSRLAHWRERLGILPMALLGLIAAALVVASMIDGPLLNPGTVIGGLGLAWVAWSLFRRFKRPGV